MGSIPVFLVLLPEFLANIAGHPKEVPVESVDLCSLKTKQSFVLRVTYSSYVLMATGMLRGGFKRLDIRSCCCS
jgi:hypothetical protein